MIVENFLLEKVNSIVVLDDNWGGMIAKLLEMLNF